MHLQDSPPEALITEASLAAAREMIGIYLRAEGPFLQSMNQDTMRNFCNGIGDLNPLYRDLEYGRYSRHGTVVAHPMIPISFGYVGRARWGFPGVHAFFGGNDWEFFRTWRPGDHINCIERVVDVVEKQSSFSGRLVLQYTEATFINQRDDLMARTLGWCTRHERGATRSIGKYKASEPYRYQPEQLEAIESLALNERGLIRGNEIRYWQDVTAGQELAPIVRGPLTLMDLNGFSVGIGRGLTHALVLEEAQRHPGHYFRNKDVGGAVEYTGIGHRRDSSARQMGVASGYDIGPARLCWLTSLVTNWMGDSAFLKRVRGEMRGFNLIGDTTWCKGKVVKTYEQAGFPLVDLEIWAENQHGTVTAPGLATVMLPSKDRLHKPVVDGSGLNLGLPAN